MELDIRTIDKPLHDTQLIVTVDGQTIQLNLGDWQTLMDEVRKKLKNFQQEF